MNLLIAHIIADYFLQPNEMAINKSQPTIIGYLWCTLHCSIYTACIALAGEYTIAGLAIVFFSHWLIDHLSLGWLYMRFVLGWPAVPDQGRILFLPVVYVAIDNGMHLGILYWLKLEGLL